MAYDAYNGAFLWETQKPRRHAHRGLQRARARQHGRERRPSFHARGRRVRAVRCRHRRGRPHPAHPRRAEGKPRSGATSPTRTGCSTAPPPSARKTPPKRARRGKSVSISTDTIFAYDAKTGALKWQHQGQHISHVSIAIGDGRVFFIDSSLTPAQRDELLRQDKIRPGETHRPGARPGGGAGQESRSAHGRRARRRAPASRSGPSQSMSPIAAKSASAAARSP